MTEPHTDFETRLAAALRERAERGVSGTDPAVLARSVMGERRPSRLTALLLRLNPRHRLAWLTIAFVVAAVLLAATLLLGVARPTRIGVLAVATSSGIEIVNVDDGTAGPISPSGAGIQSRSSGGWWTTYLSWSPDGSWLAYQSDPGTVRLVRPDGSSDHLLATGYSIDGAQAAEWSPDSTKLALHNDATNAIDLIDVTNGAETRLTSDVGLRMFAPRWSPDGHQILMSGQDALGEVELYLIDAAGTNLRKLTDKHETISAGEWSPDGRQIMYTDQSASGAEGRLYVMNSDGTGVRPLKDDTHGQFYGVWSPDGAHIAYNDHEPSPEAWYVAVVDVASGVSHRLAIGTFPRWSPDGRWIAYADTLPGVDTVNPSSGKESSRRLGVLIIDSSGPGAPRLIAELLPAGSFAWRP